MTTKIETIYNSVVDVIEAALDTDFKRLPNPYSVDTNTALQLRKGFGVQVGPGNDTQRFVGCIVTWERIFSIIVVRQMAATQNDIGSRELIEQDLLIDHDLLRKAFYNESTLSGEVYKSTVLSDSGFNFVEQGNMKFMAIVMDLHVEYGDDPTA